MCRPTCFINDVYGLAQQFVFPYTFSLLITVLQINLSNHFLHDPGYLFVYISALYVIINLFDVMLMSFKYLSVKYIVCNDLDLFDSFFSEDKCIYSYCCFLPVYYVSLMIACFASIKTVL